MIKTVEILTYQLHPNTGAIFHNIMQTESVPLHQKSDIAVLYFGNSLSDNDCYILIRSYDTIADMEQSQEMFYSSFAWKNSLREKIVSRILESTQIVLEIDMQYFNPMVFIK